MPTTTLVFSPSKFTTLLEQSGVSRGALARSFGGDGRRSEANYRNQITWWAKGRRVPSRLNIERLAKGLGCSVEDICDEVEL
ncbi:helix-turn-helix domain-containing protein [Sphaerisporangium dianthi]|uniref:Helix-turn-helix domain-containing protein n=1 Tax=Sphaerisporangium dianthi TaxID=1436120 RepID=A0ABV9CEV2_9ACTN